MRLEVIVLLGTMTTDEICAKVVLKSGIIEDVLKLLNGS